MVTVRMHEEPHVGDAQIIEFTPACGDPFYMSGRIILQDHNDVFPDVYEWGVAYKYVMNYGRDKDQDYIDLPSVYPLDKELDAWGWKP